MSETSDYEMAIEEGPSPAYTPEADIIPNTVPQQLPVPRSYPDNPEDSRDIIEAVTGHSLEVVMQGFDCGIHLPLYIYRDIMHKIEGATEGVLMARGTWIRRKKCDPWSDFENQNLWPGSS